MSLDEIGILKTPPLSKTFSLCTLTYEECYDLSAYNAPFRIFKKGRYARGIEFETQKDPRHFVRSTLYRFLKNFQRKVKGGKKKNPENRTKVAGDGVYTTRMFLYPFLIYASLVSFSLFYSPFRFALFHFLFFLSAASCKTDLSEHLDSNAGWDTVRSTIGKSETPFSMVQLDFSWLYRHHLSSTFRFHDLTISCLTLLFLLFATMHRSSCSFSLLFQLNWILPLTAFEWTRLLTIVMPDRWDYSIIVIGILKVETEKDLTSPLTPTRFVRVTDWTPVTRISLSGISLMITLVIDQNLLRVHLDLPSGCNRRRLSSSFRAESRPNGSRSKSKTVTV